MPRMISWWEKYQVDVPEGQCGHWRIERFSVSEKEAGLERILSLSHGGRAVPSGAYTRLMRGNCLVMSDTPDEIRDHFELLRRAEGRVLIHGLGLGMAVQGCLINHNVGHVTVIEKSSEVIALAGAHYLERFGTERLEIIPGDAFAWKPPRGARWDCVWHDIWDDLCTTNLTEMHTLHRRFGRRCNWQGSWGRWQCERARRAGL